MTTIKRARFKFDYGAALGVGVRYKDISPHLCREFAVRRFKRPSIIWLNESLLTSRGLDVEDGAFREDIEKYLLSTFAVSAPSHFDPPLGLGRHGRNLTCDSYGAPNGSIHGGSGRVGAVDGLQAKGIGRTPLAAHKADDFHSNGCLWLEEGIREVILSEVVCSEYPFGGVPSIALIDTGEQLYWSDGTKAPFRTILIRPEVIRLAHLQRSIFFGTSGFVGSDQELDARRTRDVWRWFNGIDDGLSTEVRLGNSFFRFGVQYGWSHVTRLWPGPFYSSNVALDGRLLDFGSMGWLNPDTPNRADSPGRGFGDEGVFVEASARSLASLARKYGAPDITPEDLLRRYTEGLGHGRKTALAHHGQAAMDPRIALPKDGIARQSPSRSLSKGHRFHSSGQVPHRPSLDFKNLVAACMSLAGQLTPAAVENRAMVTEFIRTQQRKGGLEVHAS